MKSPFRVEIIVRDSGERLALLLDQEGVPDFNATLYSLRKLRPTGQGVNTISIKLRTIMQFYVWCAVSGIDYTSRLQNLECFTYNEVDMLVRFLKYKYKFCLSELSRKPKKKVVFHPIAIRSGNKDIFVNKVNHHTRISNVADYINYIYAYYVNIKKTRGVDTSNVENDVKQTIKHLLALRPLLNWHDTESKVDSMSDETLEKILDVIEPDNPNNPWANASEHVRVRNRLIVYILLTTGMRKGEMLNLENDDFDFRKDELRIVKKNDSPEDPRKHQPLVKTKERDIPIKSKLADFIYAYIQDYRPYIKCAVGHGYLLVSDRDGRPLSTDSITKLFTKLSSSVGVDISAHQFRHRWNYDFSNFADKEKWSENKQHNLRCLLNGWSIHSETGKKYNKRFVKEEMRQAMANLQDELLPDI